MLAHLALAVAIQLLGRLALRSWWAGALAASAWAIAREITQAEYRWIERFGDGLRANMPWWGGLDPAVWGKLDPWFDWSLPTFCVFLIALLAERRRESVP